jgi:hypothetical protein
MDTALAQTPAVMFDRGEVGFDLACELNETVQLPFSFAQLDGAVRRGARAVVVDEDIARQAIAAGVDLGQRVLLIGRMDSTTLWETAREVDPFAVLNIGVDTDTASLAAQVGPLL